MADPGLSDDAVVAATGKGWDEWRALLDGNGARDLPHSEIVKGLHGEPISPWWRQMVTVGYERMIGRRVLGQNCDGDFAASAGKTVTGSKEQAFANWQALVETRIEYAGSITTGEPRSSASEKWLYWKLDLDNGSRVQMHFSDKEGGKAVVGVEHIKLADKQAVLDAKAFWKPLFAELAAL